MTDKPHGMPQDGSSLESKRAEFLQIHLSLQDLQEARDFLGRMQELYEADQADAERILIRALQSAMIVAYNRPFTKTRPDGTFARALSRSLCHSLPDDLRLLHEDLRVLRDQEFAHSDHGPVELSVNWRVRQYGCAFPIALGRQTRIGVELTELPRMQRLLDSLLSALHERWVALGTSLAG